MSCFLTQYFVISQEKKGKRKGGKKTTSVQTHIVVESLGLAGVFTCVSPLRSRTVQVPENAAKHRVAVRGKNDDQRETLKLDR